MTGPRVTRPGRLQLRQTRRGAHAECLRLAGHYRRLAAFYLATLARDRAGAGPVAAHIARAQLRRAQALRMLGLGRVS